jgi:hypothetical protein
MKLHVAVFQPYLKGVILMDACWLLPMPSQNAVTNAIFHSTSERDHVIDIVHPAFAVALIQLQLLLLSSSKNGLCTSSTLSAIE